MNVLQKLSRKEADRLDHVVVNVNGPTLGDERASNSMDCTSQASSTAGLQNHQMNAGMPPFLTRNMEEMKSLPKAPESPSFSKNKNINNLNLNLSPVANSSTFSFSKSPPALKTLFVPYGQSSQISQLSPMPTSLTFGGGNLLQPIPSKEKVEINNVVAESPKHPAITTSFTRTSVAQQDTAYISVQTTSNNLTTMLKAPPLICEQGPSTPASPTTPNKKRPCPLSVDALQRFDLLSPNYQPNHYMSSMDSKLSPLSPGYPTSDLGSSPRSSISISHRDSLTTGLAGLNTGQSLSAANWAVFRDFAQAQARVNRTHSSHSDYGGEEMVDTVGHYLTPGQALSPAPFSPFSDCGLDSSANTPYSNRSPNLSPLPSSLHFSFEQIQRSRSSMSNRCQSNDISNSKSPCSRRKTKHHLYRNNRHYKNKDSGSQQKSLDQEARERSRSEADMLINKCKRSLTNSNDEDEEMDDSIDQSTFSVPLRVSNSFTQHSNGGQYKKRLLQKYRSEQEKVLEKSGNKEENVNYLQLSNTSSKDQEDVGQSVSAQPSLQVSRQPTIEEPPPSPTFAELFHSRDLNKERQQQVEEWIRQQAAALETFRNSLVPLQQESNLLQVPNTTAVPLVPPNSMDHSLLNSSLHLLSPNPNQTLAPGPIKPATLWRRSRSESDVSTNQSPMPINDAAFICEHCGQGFAMHDRLAKHIASRHRDRSASVNDENSKIHKCTLCPKSFGRSDMLTRHLRLHSGIKPYACQLCGQVFSRSDHLSTHQRTHTGEKPYRCPHCNYAASRRDMITRHMRTHLIDGLMNADGSPVAFTEVQAHELQIPPIGQLSLNHASTPEPSCHNTSSTSQISMIFNNNNGPPTVSSPGPSTHLSSPVPPLASAAMPNSSTSLSPAVSSLNLNVASTNSGLCAGGINRSPSLTITPATSNELLSPNFANLFQFKPKSSVDASALGIDEATRIGLLSAAAANSSLTHMLTSLGKSLDAQVPNTSMCRSSPNIPNLLNQLDHPSAFKPLKTNVQQADSQQTSQDSMQQAAVAAMNQLFGGMSQANPTPSISAFSPNLSTAGFNGPPSGRLSPSILRQNSIGGIGFLDAAPATTTK